MAGSIKIGTHSGAFHCDEILACSMLKKLPEYKNAEIVRSRDIDVLATCDIVVDVGGIYDHAKKRYDHHQRGFSHTMRNFDADHSYDIKLSSAGLVYAHYGKQVLAAMTGLSETSKDVDLLYDKLYSALISEVDAIDNGVEQFTGKPVYTISTGLSARVARFNPSWNKPEQTESDGFKKAFEMVDAEFTDIVQGYFESWMPAKVFVKKAVEDRFSVHPTGYIMELADGLPWKQHFFEIETEMVCKEEKKQGDSSSSFTIKPGCVLFALVKRYDGNWSATAIPETKDRPFSSRLAFLDKWRGLRSKELSAVVGIEDCEFVHSTGFLGIHKSREGALHLMLETIRAAGVDLTVNGADYQSVEAKRPKTEE